MPYQDGTGPWGDGRPGRGMGPCGRGAASGGGRRGGGRGGRMRGCGAYPINTAYAYTKENLAAQKADLEAQLDWVNKELEK